MKGIQCYELFGGIALKIHTFSFSFSMSHGHNCFALVSLCSRCDGNKDLTSLASIIKGNGLLLLLVLLPSLLVL